MSYLVKLRNKNLSVTNEQLLPMLFGLQIFLYTSLFRGFVSTGIVYIIDTLGMAITVPALSGLVPILLFPLIAKFVNFKDGIRIILVLWLVTSLSPVVIVNFVIFMVAMSISYSNMVQMSKELSSKFEYPLIGVYFLFFDNVFRAANGGNDPTTSKSLVMMLLLLFSIILLLSIPLNRSDLSETKSATFSLPFEFLYSFGLIMNLSLYYMYFANSGQIVFHMGLTGALGVTVYFLCNLLVILVLIFGNEYLTKSPLVLVAGALMFIGVLANWVGFAINIFWIFTFMGNIILISYFSYQLIENGFSRHFVFLTVLVVNLAMIFLALSSDDTIFPLILGIIGILPLLGVVLKPTKEGSS